MPREAQIYNRYLLALDTGTSQRQEGRSRARNWTWVRVPNLGLGCPLAPQSGISYYSSKVLGQGLCVCLSLGHTQCSYVAVVCWAPHGSLCVAGVGWGVVWSAGGERWDGGTEARYPLQCTVPSSPTAVPSLSHHPRQLREAGRVTFLGDRLGNCG